MFDDETRAKAIDKLDNISVFVGWYDYYAPEILSRAEGGTYLINTSRACANALELNIRCCADKANYNQAIFDSFDDVNAFYYYFSNSMYVPAGILGGAFYDPDASHGRIMGSIGMVIGHEIGHAFDSDGSCYDSNGGDAYWFSEESAAAYEEVKNRFLTYYGGFETLSGVVQDPAMTLDENIADFSSMSIITDCLSGDPDAQRDALEAFAVMWREVLTESYKFNKQTYDEHAAHQVRVNAIVASLDCFYELYDIGEDDPMYVAPEDRLIFW